MIPIPKGTVAYNAKEAYTIARKFGHDSDRKFVVKAQVQYPARSKGVFRENGFKGGIHIVDTHEEVKEVASKMCGKHLVFPNGHSDGLLV